MAAPSDSQTALEDVRAALQPQAPPGALAELLADVHVADLGEWMLELEEEENARIFAVLDSEERAELLEYAPDAVRLELVESMTHPELVEVIEVMPDDEVVDLLSLADSGIVETVLQRLDFERAKDLRELADYPEDSAGGLMTTEFPSVGLGSRIGDAIKEFKTADEEMPEDPGGTFVVDGNGCPVGYLSGHQLLTNSIHDPVEDVMATELHPVSPYDDQESVAHLMLKYGLEAVAVVDRSGVLIGVVSHDDLSEVLAEEAQEDILKIVGAAPVEQTRLPVLVRVRQRIPLQMLTVVGGLVTAWILDLALGGSEQAAGDGALLRYLPIIIGLAGNVGIQSSTILVRAFATGELQQGRELAVLGSEVLTGLTIGLICGATTALVAALMEASAGPDWTFGLAVGSAIAVAVSWAAFLGCVVPMVCRRTPIDPAVVAGPFLITMSDVSGAVIFMVVAHLVLSGGAPTIAPS